MASCLSKDYTYLVFGLARIGIATSKFFEKYGYNFYATDDNEGAIKGLEVDEKHKIYDYKKIIKDVDFIVLSQGVHVQNHPHKIVELAQKNGVELISDVDIFYNHIRQRADKNDKKIIAITGTNGKSTTTALTAHILNKTGHKAIACGNIGLAVLADEVDIDKYDFFVVEMSSTNLHLTCHTTFDCGCLLNITEDHIEYHGSMESYATAKEKCVSCSKIAVVCVDDDYTKDIAERHDNVVRVSKNGVLKSGFSWAGDVFYENEQKIEQIKFQNLLGTHNVENILCSCAVCAQFGVDFHAALQATKTFTTLHHRMEFVREIDGIKFINDSKATNADSTQKALRALGDNNIYLIAGGRRKTAGLLALKDDLRAVKYVFLIGEATESFAEELNKLNKKFVKCGTMQNAIKTAFEEAKKNNTCGNKIVLLSPVCSSWDQYSCFEERGEDFCKTVNQL